MYIYIYVEMITKSSDKDMLSKKRWVFVDVYTRLLHWAKSEASASVTKSIPLVGCTVTLVNGNNGLGSVKIATSGKSEEGNIILEVG